MTLSRVKVVIHWTDHWDNMHYSGLVTLASVHLTQPGFPSSAIAQWA